MKLGDFSYPMPANEPILMYAPGSAEKKALKAKLAEMKGEVREVPMMIGGEEVKTGKTMEMRPPHETGHLLGTFHYGEKEHVSQAIDAALAARSAWADTTWETRANIFLKAAELIATKYRAEINAATMLGQSKTAFQAEIDAACEIIDFLRFNVHFLGEIYAEQPQQAPGIHNRLEWRPLEGFVLAITPFNFTAIAGNLPASAAMCGNVVVWKPSDTQVYSAHVLMKVFKEAGVPDGVINMVMGDGPVVGETCFTHPEFAGVHFTGSTGVFNTMWKYVGDNIANYKSYPRVVGETGGKDFVMVHPSADVDAVVTALVRGAFEFQGQKCSAASRAYLPSNLADDVLEKLKATVATIKMGSVEDFRNFMTAVIDEKSFDKISGYIDQAKADGQKILCGGGYDKSKGYFIEPTVILADDAKYRTMCEEIFGPVLTISVYDESKFSETLDLVDSTSDYALTGAILSQDRYAVEEAISALRQSAGNFYVNDKPTGAVVGQQPFGGARKSGTNDKAGSKLNLYRWLSCRLIKETLVSPTDYRYPFMDEE